MPQSLANVLLHIVFSTKNREPFLQAKAHRQALCGYVVGTLRNLRCPSLIVEAMTDHIHILCNLARTVSIAKLLEEIKTDSSSWVKKLDPALAAFYWQNGYGAFSVSQMNAGVVRAYIANQEEHHRTRSSQDEYRELLTLHGIAFDERYVWD